MKKILLFISIAAGLLCFNACNFLDEENYTELDTEKFFKDPANVDFAVKGCYDLLQNVAPQYVTCLEVPTDYVCVSPNAKHAQETTWHNGVFTYNDAWPANVWSTVYKVIYACNQVIDNIEAASLEEVRKNAYLGEVRFLRAWGYLVLTNMFKDVPLRTTSKFGDTFDCPLSTREEIYDFIISELDFAAANLFDLAYGRTLPDSKGLYAETDKMRVTVDAALGMQALAYLYRAGNDAGSPYWEKARDKALEVINRRGGIESAISGGWLSGSYYGLFHGSTRYCAENMFTVYFDNGSKTEGSSLANAWAIYKNYSMAPNAGYRRFTNLWYEKHFKQVYDLRNIDGILHEIINANGAKFIFPSKPDFMTEMGREPADGYVSALGAKPYGPWTSKYADTEATTSNAAETGINFLRYADVLLVFAEAENEVNGPSSDAYKALNMIRERAKTEAAPEDMTKDEFRTYVIEEREREFFGECKRFFDLNRREMYGEMVMKSAGAVEYEGVNRTRNYSVLTFQIPKDEVDTNAELR